jgi:hypothetical protein
MMETARLPARLYMISWLKLPLPSCCCPWLMNRDEWNLEKEFILIHCISTRHFFLLFNRFLEINAGFEIKHSCVIPFGEAP